MNSPAAIALWLLLPALALVGLWLLLETAAARVDRDVAVALSRELPDVPLFDQDDPCLNPGLHARQGCQPCTRFIQASKDYLTAEAIYWLPTADVDR